MLLPNTAELGRSVWDSIGRKTFEGHIDALHQTGFVPKSWTLSEKDWPKQRSQDVLPFATEKQLCDDLSFIAAYEYGVGYVTVATVELVKSEPGGLILRLAANEGVCNLVVEEIGRVLGTLEKCAQKKLSRNQCVDETFDTVIRLNQNRILGRLASKFFRRPAYDRGPPRKQLTGRFSEFVNSRQPKQSSHDFSDFRRLCEQINTFHTSFLQLEASPAEEIVTLLKSVVKDAFSITVDGCSLPDRLEKIGFPMSMTDTREVREVNKIANYWRVCLSLAHLSRSYRIIFSKLRLDVLEPYQPSVTGDTKLRKFVHAEVQMVIFYETSVSPPWPRAIGGSKEACFLCDSFVKAHGHFHLSKAHRQVFPQWTIPDLKDYSNTTLRRFRTALVGVAQSIREELENARRNHCFQPFPLQSSINLQRLTLPPPSVTTVRSSRSEIVHTASPVEHTATPESGILEAVQKPCEDSSILSDVVPINGDMSGSPYTKMSLMLSPELEPVPEAVPPDLSFEQEENSSITAGSTSPTRRRHGPEISFTSTRHMCLEWISLHVELECASLTGNRDPDFQATFSRASVGLESIHDYDAVREYQQLECINIDALAPGEETTVVRRECDSHDRVDPEIELVLMNRYKTPLRMKCRWHRA